MRRMVMVLVIFLATSLQLFAKLPSDDKLQSIRFLTEVSTDSEGVQTKAQQCTTWSLNEKKGLWVTASHCVFREWGEETESTEPAYRTLELDTKPVTVVEVRRTDDLALLQADVHYRGLRLGDRPKVGDEAMVYGYPLRIPNPVALFLRVSSIWYPIEFWLHTMLFSGHGWPGHSGSPILDHKGRVISVCQGSILLERGDVGGTLGVAYEPLKAFGEGLWE